MELDEVPFHPQQAHHCGPASLLTILEASGRSVEYRALVDRVFVPGLEGSLQAELAAAPRVFGRISYRLDPEPAAVFAEIAAGRPVLVLLNLGVPSRPIWHYAVAIGFDPGSNKVILRSGDARRQVQRARPWLRRWDWAGRWAIVVLSPGELPVGPDKRRLFESLAAFEDVAEPPSVGEAWAAALRLWPDEPVAWLGAGNAAYGSEDWKGASEAYRRALELDPGNLPARLNLGLSLVESGEACQALDHLGAPPAEAHPLAASFADLHDRLVDRCDR